MGILFILSWFLASAFLCYLSLKPKMPILLKIVLIVLILVIEKELYDLERIIAMFDDLLYYGLIGILMIQLLACTIYRIKYTFIGQRLIGVLSFIGIGIYMYYNGSVIGEIQYFISDAGGMHSKLDYNVYRWLTYTWDVLIPWFLLFNIVVSPFWLRNAKGKLLIKDIFRFDSCK